MSHINIVQDWEVWQICLKFNNLLVYILILLQFFFHSRLANNNSVDGMQYALGMQIPQKPR